MVEWNIFYSADNALDSLPSKFLLIEILVTLQQNLAACLIDSLTHN